MSIEDRDWYRAEFKRRQAAAEAAARPGWDKVERPRFVAQPTPSQTSRLRFGPLGWLTVIATCLIAAHNGGYIGVPAWQARLAGSGAAHASAPPAVAFPVNGATSMFAPVDLATSAPLTLQTSATAPSSRFVVSVRNWYNDQPVATIYLETNTVVTEDLPAGRYRVLIARGQQWAGDQRLFGPDTQVDEVREPISLERYGSRAVGHILYLMDTANPNLSMDRVSIGLFSSH